MAWQVQALVARDEGKMDVARALFEKVRSADATIGHRSAVDRLNAITQFAALEFDAANYFRARQMAVEATNFASQNLGEVNLNLSSARRLRVNSLERLGQYRDAVDEAAVVLEPEVNSGNALRAGTAWLTHARAFLSAKRMDEARDALDVAAKALETYPFWLNRLRLLRAELHLVNGDHQRALAVLDTTPVGVQSPRQSRDQAAALELRSLAHAAAGRWERAREDIETACNVRRAIHAEDHPLRLHCEAQRVVLSGTTRNDDKALALERLSLVIGGRSDTIVLATSLQRTRVQLMQTPSETKEFFVMFN